MNILYTPIESARLKFWSNFNHELYLQILKARNAS